MANETEFCTYTCTWAEKQQNRRTSRHDYDSFRDFAVLLEANKKYLVHERHSVIAAIVSTMAVLVRNMEKARITDGVL